MRYKGKAGKLWELCKEIVRKRDGMECVACGRTISTLKNCHTGHLIPASVCGAYLRFDLRNIHVCCYNCNINLGGNGAIFRESLERKYGDEWVVNLMSDRHKIIKADDIFYQRLIDTYRPLVDKSMRELLQETKNHKRANKGEN